ncbi:carboxyltransferase domain-containing protein [Micromonospora sp. WMMD964]|uniref:5-oxoprolinase subunit B family protein n=1 Tax=Micromonospora sp. WMMD964 TaxID=3016091 RepID=UPI00249B13DD|nr:carboxyltransferase domain-containing protein [Micromonospora sp. WMMD964]WFF02250.1 carboxyltransferase domain-containing protein [Micromonospora sp. WMMD964]
MRIRPVGVHALLLDCTTDDDTPHDDDAPHDDVPEADVVDAWRAELWRRREQGDLIAVEIVPAASTVLLDGLPDPSATAEQLARWAGDVAAAAANRPASAVAAARTGERDALTGTVDRDPVAGAADRGSTTRAADRDVAEVVVPVCFDGPDLPTVAEHWNVDVPAVLRRLTGTRFRVAFCGFAPGFPYLTGLPAELALPRLATPRPRVPAGSVALAGPYAGIYPGASPGGWQLVGRTELVLFDVHADPPARLGPGTLVRMVAT